MYKSCLQWLRFFSSHSIVNNKNEFRLLKMQTMKTKLKFLILGALLLSLGLSVFAQGTAFTYQGRLNDAYGPANGSYDLSFTLFNTGSGPSQIGSPITNSATSVSNGLFVVKLDFGNGVFNGTNYWLEIAVQTNGGVGFTTLAPRQPVTPTPYAIYAEGASNVLGTISAGQISGSVGNGQLANSSVTVTAGTGLSGGGNVALGGTVTLNNTGVLSVNGGGGVNANAVNGNVTLTTALGGDLSGSLDAAKVVSIQQTPVSSSAPTTSQFMVFDGTKWSPQTVQPWLQGGNGGTTAGVNFLGTTDNQPLEFEVNSQRVLRLEPTTQGEPNIIGGSSANAVAPGVYGAVINGGGNNGILGTNGYSTIGGGNNNAIQDSADDSTISGGAGNRIQTSSYNSCIGGGFLNVIQTNAVSSTIGGGQGNAIQNSASYSLIAGGTQNTIQTNAIGSAIAGGVANVIGSGVRDAVIGGGGFNTNTGNYAIVPGGYENLTGADFSFAAGNRAKAVHQGAFVWADSQPTDFSSTASDQFAVRAQGGVKLVTGGAGLTVDGQSVLAGTNATITVNTGLGLSGGGTVALGGTITLTNLGILNLVSGSAGLDIIQGGNDALINVNLGGDVTGNPGTAKVVAIQQTPVSASAPLSGQFLIYDGIRWSPQTLNGSAWQLGGNSGTTAGVNFVGTTDNQPLEFKVNNQRALRLEPNAASGSPNVIGGAPGNFVQAGVVGAVIGGGGATNYYGGVYSNSISADFGVIGGGIQNSIQTGATNSTIGGGQQNTVTISANFSTIGGGYGNMNAGVASSIGGGVQNGEYANYGVIGGGMINSIAPLDEYSTIGGGYYNRIWQFSAGSMIGGGISNTVQDSASDVTIGGGNSNTVGGYASFSTIGGGQLNTIQNNAKNSTIGGGNGNTIQGNSFYSVIGGGYANTVQDSATNSTISGGAGNVIQSASYVSAIGGGAQNTILANSPGSMISGGFLNTIQTNAPVGVIVGGYINTIQTNSPGGIIVGGSQNVIQANVQSGIILGGAQNTIMLGANSSTIVGGSENVIASGALNATIGGGIYNTNSGYYAVIPGGDRNVASGNNSFAAGNQAKAVHPGAFVWADSQNADFSSTANDQFAVRAQGGVTFASGSGGANQSVSWTPGGASWSFSSDRNLKDRFAAVDHQSVLDKVAQLPIVEWSYKGYEQRHIGPMAQDFHALFPLNENDKALQDADLHGVALAAIKGLNQKVEELKSELSRKDAENATLQQRLERIEKLVTEHAGGVR